MLLVEVAVTLGAPMLQRAAIFVVGFGGLTCVEGRSVNLLSVAGVGYETAAADAESCGVSCCVDGVAVPAVAVYSVAPKVSACLARLAVILLAEVVVKSATVVESVEGSCKFAALANVVAYFCQKICCKVQQWFLCFSYFLAWRWLVLCLLAKL